MACNTSLTSILKSCDNNVGGLTNFYVIPAEFVTGTTVTTGTVTNIGLSGGVFVEYQFNKIYHPFTKLSREKVEAYLTRLVTSI